MEIQGIGSAIAGYGKTQTTLTDEQKGTLEEILAKYDPENMSAEDRKALREELQEAGIPRCRETMNIMKEAGFAPPMPPPAHAGGMMGPGGMQPETDEEEDSEVQSMYEQLIAGEITQEEFTAYIEGLLAAGAVSNGSLFNKSV